MINIEVPSTSGLIANVVLNVFSAFTAIVFNSITIKAIKKTSSLPNPLKILLLSLALSDLAVGLVAQPLWIVNILRKKDTEVLWIIQSALANASFLGIMALSVDRFLAVHLHLRYRELVTYKRVLRLAILTWVLSALLSSICYLVTVHLDLHKIFFKFFFSLFFPSASSNNSFTLKRSHFHLITNEKYRESGLKRLEARLLIECVCNGKLFVIETGYNL